MANKYNITAKETWPTRYSHINGTPEEILDRFAVSELCRAWPVYRDASEWQNYRDAWADKGSYLWTTWGGGVDIDDFIQISIKGREAGDFIMHRENGTLVELNPKNGRACGKMKATITQRYFFEKEGACDVECDCRFIFFCRKGTSKTGQPEWKIQYVKLFYEKDKVIPLDGKPLPDWDQSILNKFPEGYRWLGAAQEKLGHNMLYDLPAFDNQGFWDLLKGMNLWLEGKDEEVVKALGVPGA
ncbi:hypothetical protein PRZ48_004151 [Zasmidium cellare]|uniref:SnoaL-like domain-containing protein n=1 Tax=Zasmidium cellare TaxID=395010 RepID=A0ABR0EYE6_ZASCE|nr:hypothetical protein PRZ48_004151 [Zasmidium cellare]